MRALSLVRAAVARVGAPALRPGGGVVLAQCIFTSKRKTGCKTKIMDRKIGKVGHRK
uniref:Uncharacterized protein n=1 Tax=Castor canadensis TaxID=51338 RepID=A0A8C0XL04_CASCN